MIFLLTATKSLIEGGPNQYFNPNAFIQPLPGTYGNVGRNTQQGPSLVQTVTTLTPIAFGEFWRVNSRAGPL
jgi:hypothetical protein